MKSSLFMEPCSNIFVFSIATVRAFLYCSGDRLSLCISRSFMME
ncbi:MAG TPA: hypothetical protein PLA51_10290 [Spirochaetota bacterium]|nr:hypothetical protein [Spirochaetota bacterium]